MLHYTATRKLQYLYMYLSIERDGCLQMRAARAPATSPVHHMQLVALNTECSLRSLQLPPYNATERTYNRTIIFCDGIHLRLPPAWSAKKNPLAQPPRHVAVRSAPQAPALGYLANANDAPLRLLI